MARTKTNKSAAIKEALKANADKGPSEIAEMLKKQGVKVTATYVSNIKTTMGNGKKRGKPGPKKATAGRPKTSSQPISNGFSDVQSTVVFVKGVGGLKKAKQLIALLESARGL